MEVIISATVAKENNNKDNIVKVDNFRLRRADIEIKVSCPTKELWFHEYRYILFSKCFTEYISFEEDLWLCRCLQVARRGRNLQHILVLRTTYQSPWQSVFFTWGEQDLKKWRKYPKSKLCSRPSGFNFSHVLFGIVIHLFRFQHQCSMIHRYYSHTILVYDEYFLINITV